MAPSHAEDVVQETWAAVIDGLDRFEGRSSLKTWVLRILSNRAKTWIKREKRLDLEHIFTEEAAVEETAVAPERFSRIGNWSAPPAAWSERTPEAIVLRMETGMLLARVVEELPQAQRIVVTLRDVEGLSSDEVCDILGVTEANQRVLLHRGRSKVRSAMERYLSEP